MTQQQQTTTTPAGTTTTTTTTTTTGTTTENLNNFNLIKTFSTRNKSSLSISTNTNNNNNNISPPTTNNNYSQSPPSSPSNHAKNNTQLTIQSSPNDQQQQQTIDQQQQQQQQQNHFSTSSVGPNVAGRIGVGGNVMVDPYNPSHLSHRGTIGAGAFVYKVYNMLLDPSFQHLISFNSNGQSFTVNHVQEFSKTVLPKHFKHNNFSSFVRQLNMYGFHKVNKTPRGQRGNDTSAAWEFLHPKFHRGRPDLLEQIRRKTLDHDSVPQLIRKDHPHFIQSHHQSSPTGYRFPLDSLSFLPNPSHHPPAPYQFVRTGPSSTLPQHRPHSEGTINLSPTAPTHHLHIPDTLNPSQQPTLLETGGGGGSAMSPLLHGPSSSDRYPNPFLHSPYSMDPISTSTSQTSSAPITPLSAVPPPSSSSPLHRTLDPNRFSNNPIEILLEMKNDVSNRFQGVHVSYEQLYQELHETRRKQKILIDLVEKMYKSLQSVPNLNLGYEFPSQELLGEAGGETTPIFKITEHGCPDPSPMIFEDSNTQQQQQQQCPVSMGTSPPVSEFGHTNQASSDSGYRSFSVCPGGFGNLTLASYPNSPVGGLMGEQAQAQAQQSSNRNSPHSPQSVTMIPDRTMNETGLLETEPLNRFLNPTVPVAHHSQHLRGNELQPISPRAALSVALKTPLPPSPAPFKGGTEQGSMSLEGVTNQGLGTNEEYQHAIESLMHSQQQANLTMMQGEFDERNPPPGYRPSSTRADTTDDSVLVKTEEVHPTFDKIMLPENLIFPTTNTNTNTNANTNSNTNTSNNSASNQHSNKVVHSHHHNPFNFKSHHHHHHSSHSSFSHGPKKRPASLSMDLDAGISHHFPLTNLAHHSNPHSNPHLQQNHNHNHNHHQRN